jgi:hypothetical protein
MVPIKVGPNLKVGIKIRGGRDEVTVDQLQAIVMKADKDDPISDQLDEIVQAVERICRPAIQEAAR